MDDLEKLSRTQTKAQQEFAACKNKETRRALAGGQPMHKVKKEFESDPDNPDRKMKDCLRCHRPFVSEGRHNHLCEKCNEINERVLSHGRRVIEAKNGHGDPAFHGD